MTTQAKLGNSLLQSLIQLRAQKGGLNPEEVGAIFEQMASTLQPDASSVDGVLRKEIERMAQYIESAKKEINAGAPKGKNVKPTGNASLHLEAVIKATEEASNNIIDATDEIQGAVAGIGGETEQKIMHATMRIYESCNFQDLTGQRITKVIAMIETIDERIGRLVALSHGGDADVQTNAAPSASAKVFNGNFTDKDLLNGPQLPGAAPSQADIDALFSSLKP